MTHLARVPEHSFDDGDGPLAQLTCLHLNHNRIGDVGMRVLGTVVVEKRLACQIRAVGNPGDPKAKPITGAAPGPS